MAFREPAIYTLNTINLINVVNAGALARAYNLAWYMRRLGSLSGGKVPVGQPQNLPSQHDLVITKARKNYIKKRTFHELCVWT